MLPIPAAFHTLTGGRRRTMGIIASKVAIKLAGTKNAQMLMQLVREKSAKVLKSNITF